MNVNAFHFTNFRKTFFLVFFISLYSASAKSPNFLFILVDDLGRQDLGIEGSTYYETPHIDEFARSGMRFTQGYANCRVCSPSRASIMLGQYTTRHGITDWIGAKTGVDWNRNDRVLPTEYVWNLPHESISMAEALKGSGYTTFFAGKWHLGAEGSYPEDHGFDFNVGGHHRGSPPGGFFSPYKNPKMKDGPSGESLPIRLAQETANFMANHKDKPFLAFLSFYSVHGPIQTSPDLWKKYREKAILQGLVDARFKFDRTMAVRQVQDNPIYAGMMESLDDAVGIVLNQLTELGLDHNTVVVFTSDNGGVTTGDAFSTSALPFRGGKGRQWEGGIREPYYIRAPGITTPNSICDVPVMGADFYPTFLDLADVDVDASHDVDGVSLVPLLKGAGIAERDLFWHYPHYGNQGGEPSAIIRSGDWKLIHYYEDGRDELYQLSEDTGEIRNLAKAHPERVQTMRSRLDQWLEGSGARIPAKDDRFDLQYKKEQLNTQRTERLQKLEKQHLRFLDENFVPNKNWWGSVVPQD